MDGVVGERVAKGSRKGHDRDRKGARGWAVFGEFGRERRQNKSRPIFHEVLLRGCRGRLWPQVDGECECTRDLGDVTKRSRVGIAAFSWLTAGVQGGGKGPSSDQGPRPGLKSTWVHCALSKSYLT
jgi:hypothetical protein